MAHGRRELAEAHPVKAGCLLCLFCRAGKGEPLALRQDKEVETLREAIRRDPGVLLSVYFTRLEVVIPEGYKRGRISG